MLAACPGAPRAAAAEEAVQDGEAVRLYRTREEQREAGLRRELAPWLTVSGLAELEWTRSDFDTLEGRADDSGHNHAATLQLGFMAEASDFGSAEVILEYDTDDDRLVADEATLALEYGQWEFLFGRQYLPFGVYFSNFVSGPLLEFGETRAEAAAVLVWGPDDALDVSFSLYRGRARRQTGDSDELDWGLATELWFNHAGLLSLAYQSDLADADSRLLQDDNDRYAKRVGGISAFLLWTGDNVEIALEVLAATGAFRELDADRNRPLAWNAEIAWFAPRSAFEVAFRIEGSRELEDGPAYRFGPAVTWRAGPHASLTLEYLHSEFDGDLAVNEQDQPYEDTDSIGAILSAAF